MQIQSPARAHLFGIDPGSGKDWAVYYVPFDLRSKQVTAAPSFSWWELESLDQHIEDLLIKAGEDSTTTMLAVDVPLITPQKFMPDYIGSTAIEYPFDVNPFTMRPCEHALRSRPIAANTNLNHRRLTEMIGKLCRWNPTLNSAENVPFHKMADCEGISVMIFSEAPHQALMRVFMTELADNAPADVTITCEPTFVPRTAHLYLLESHPAVSMGFWRADNCFGDTLTKIPRYKGNLKGSQYDTMATQEKNDAVQQNLRDLAQSITAMAISEHNLAAINEIATDDQIDAFVGLLNILDLINGRGDWFGTAASGYFLVPLLKLLDGQPFSKAWSDAEVAVRRRNGERRMAQ